MAEQSDRDKSRFRIPGPSMGFACWLLFLVLTTFGLVPPLTNEIGPAVCSLKSAVGRLEFLSLQQAEAIAKPCVAGYLEPYRMSVAGESEYFSSRPRKKPSRCCGFSYPYYGVFVSPVFGFFQLFVLLVAAVTARRWVSFFVRYATQRKP